MFSCRSIPAIIKWVCRSHRQPQERFLARFLIRAAGLTETTLSTEKKAQTVVRKHEIPIELVFFNEEIWVKIQNMCFSKDVDSLYSLIWDSLCAHGEKEAASEDPHDYESPQHNGSCIYQHMQALIRDQFMSCSQLGSKAVRYAAYRLISSDFALFIGDIRFQKAINERNPLIHQRLFQAWEEKKKKLQAILSLAKDIIPGENALEYLCSLLDRTRNIQNTNKIFLNFDDRAFQHLIQTTSLYRQQLRERALEQMTNMSLEELPHRAAVNVVRTNFGDETFAIVKGRLGEYPALMEEFKKCLISRNYSGFN